MNKYKTIANSKLELEIPTSSSSFELEYTKM